MKLGGRCWVALTAALMVLILTPNQAAHAAVPRFWGITAPGVPSDLSAASALASKVNSKPRALMWYVAWSYNSAFPASDASKVSSWGATPEITWEPWNPNNGANQAQYQLAKITNGAFDSYIKSWASAIKSWGKPLQLRFAQEMNGNWYPWDEGVNGNAAGSFVPAWKHVHDLFAAAGATNVMWTWSPNVPWGGNTTLSSVYPGDSYVDAVALDGYNWGTSQSWSKWISFKDLFASGISQLSSFTTRPVAIGEVGCSETGGNKAQWIADMWTTLAQWTQVRGLMWFDHKSSTDWRIDSTDASAKAFANGVGGYLSG